MADAGKCVYQKDKVTRLFLKYTVKIHTIKIPMILLDYKCKYVCKQIVYSKSFKIILINKYHSFSKTRQLTLSKK